MYLFAVIKRARQFKSCTSKVVRNQRALRTTTEFFKQNFAFDFLSYHEQ